MARILIADNASFMRSCLRYIIENAGHEVVGMARDGAEAIEQYDRLKPDLVTLDILMDKMDGLTALGEITGKHPEAKVLMVTALGQDQTQAKARDLGCCGYIRKPFKLSEIVQELDRVLALSKRPS